MDPYAVPAFRDGMEGVEHFPHPYATPPNVAVTGGFLVLATTPLGFRWKNTTINAMQPTWTARGVRATPQQIAELSRSQSPEALKPAELPPVGQDGGRLGYADGEQGRVSFTRPFLSPPNVEVQGVIVTDITRQGFRWKHPGTKTANSVTRLTDWTAKGVLDPTGGKGSPGQ
jgi:hypothetical protein